MCWTVSWKCTARTTLQVIYCDETVRLEIYFYKQTHKDEPVALRLRAFTHTVCPKKKYMLRSDDFNLEIILCNNAGLNEDIH